MKKKTEDQLKETISKQRGEVTRLKGELEASRESCDVMAASAHEQRRIANDHQHRGRHYLDAKDLHGESLEYGDAMIEQLYGALTSLETSEYRALMARQQKRRALIELGSPISFTPFIVSDLTPLRQSISTPMSQDTAKTTKDNTNDKTK